MTQNDCMDSKREDDKLKEMRMAPDRVCDDEGPCALGGGAPPGVVAGGAISPPHPVALITSAALHLQMKEGEEGGPPLSSPSPTEQKGGTEDDDLTSLSWLLQDKNILKGINLRTAPSGVQESPTSEDSASEQGEVAEGEGDSTCSSVNSSSPVPPSGGAGGGGGGGGGGGDRERVLGVTNCVMKNKHPHHIPYDPKVHITSKPPYSFSCLIFMAIEDSPVKALPVKEIYAWILDHFPYYKNAPTGWKNSVRHNLSLNKCFCKVEKAPNLGKGSLWMVDPVYRPNLVQALKKAPYHPYAVTGSGSDRSTPTSNSQQPDSLSSGEHTPDDTPAQSKAGSNGRLLPDPDLFPYLSRRLLAAAAVAAVSADCRFDADAEAEAEDDGSNSSPLDDVDAAAAMLALKHGPHVRMSMEQRKDEYHNQLTAVNLTSKTKKKSKEEEEKDVLITSCPSADHTYSVEHTQALHTDMYTHRFHSPSKKDLISPEKSFTDSQDSNSSWAMRAVRAANGHRSSLGDQEELRKIAEGADALLNLAGFTTSLRSRSRSSTAHRAKRQRLEEEEEEEEEALVDEEEEGRMQVEEVQEVVERVPFRPRLLRKSPLKRDLKSERREERKQREKKACMKVLDYAQAIMDSMNETNNNNQQTASKSADDKVVADKVVPPPTDDKVVSSSSTSHRGDKARRKSLLTPVKHLAAKVKR
ncbi:forkhead box protein N3 [Nilaparvata lugens]|uniref:forkhead box protein N3 n=1 Tax=Nilaparvata lugens TaxID=108931 RepID=UPI00193CD1E9|nr:forkhead box protein N3 [Nilaparvata lugens]